MTRHPMDQPPGVYFGQGPPAPLRKPTLRNPLMTLLIPSGLALGGNVLGTILMSTTDMGWLRIAGTVAQIAGAVLTIVAIVRMTRELRAVTGDYGFAWWPTFVPIYNIFWAVSALPDEIRRAKKIAGVQAPTRSGVVYFFFLLYAFAADLNDIARAP
jgi:hypothetical protein